MSHLPRWMFVSACVVNLFGSFSLVFLREIVPDWIALLVFISGLLLVGEAREMRSRVAALAPFEPKQKAAEPSPAA